MTDDHRHPPVMFFALLLCWSHVFCEKMAIQEQQKGPTSVRPFYVFGWYEVRNAGCRSSVTNSDTASIHARGSQDIFTPGKPSWWFQTFFIFTPSWGRFSFFLIFFIWVETTSQKPFGLSWFWIVKRWICWPKKAHSMHLFNMDGFVVQVNLYGPGTHGMKITMKKAHHFGRNMFGHFCPRNPSWGNTHLKTRLGGGFKSCFSPRSLGKWSNSTKDF